VAVKLGHVTGRICRFSIATPPILVRSPIQKWEVKELLTLHNVCIDHVMIQSELKYLLGAKDVRLKCRDFGGKTGPIAMVRVVVW
jgi:hypothetical protein